MSNRPRKSQLTDVELELMSILWEMGSGTVRDLLGGLPPQRTMAYTSASTIVRILEKKGFVKSLKQGKAHLYKPILSRQQFEEQFVQHVVNDVFVGDRLGLIKQLIGSSESATAEEIEQLKQWIEKL